MTDHEPSDEPTRTPEVVGEDDDGDPLAGLLGGLDMGSLLSMAGEVQQQMQQAKEQAAATEVTGSAGGGAVTVTLTGAMECTGVTIAAEATDDVAMLEDLVLSAVRDALGKARTIQGDDPLAGIGDLGGLFGD